MVHDWFNWKTQSVFPHFGAFLNKNEPYQEAINSMNEEVICVKL